MKKPVSSLAFPFLYGTWKKTILIQGNLSVGFNMPIGEWLRGDMNEKIDLREDGASFEIGKSKKLEKRLQKPKHCL